MAARKTKKTANPVTAQTRPVVPSRCGCLGAVAMSDEDTQALLDRRAARKAAAALSQDEVLEAVLQDLEDFAAAHEGPGEFEI